MKTKLLVTVLCVLCVCACNPIKRMARHNIPMLQQKEWQLAAIEKDTILNTDATWPTLVFKSDGRFTGNTGCNTFYGSYYQRKMKLDLTYDGASKQLCEYMYLEERMLKMLKKEINHFTILDSVLYLYAGNEEVLRFK